MCAKIRKKEALDFHEAKPAGKIEVTPTKPLSSQHDLALAYSPGVAEPCKEIAEDKEKVYRYTAKGNLVGVISNGTAVLGLGNIGPEASKPVMEGKGVLFKKFAGIDVFDIEIDETDPDKFIEIVRSLEPTFGGINLEDIKAPESFKIERELREKMNIPVMHDDQHGTAIISSAGLINALEINGKKIEEVTIVVSGAGAAAIACTDLYVSLGAKLENIVMTDSKGVVKKSRSNLDESKARYATHREDLNTLEDALVGADVFLGLSIGNILKPATLKKMANDPIVFALANPDPEIPYDLAMKTRDDIIMATGRSDHPNQVNNVLGFPYIFRGALDVRSTAINEEMKLAAVKAIADLAKEAVPEMVLKAYAQSNLKFGPEYIIPKPLDPRLITAISPAVAKAAIDTGVARITEMDWAKYELELQERIGIDQRLISRIITRARRNPKRVVFAEADDVNILKAAQLSLDEGVAIPILLGNLEKIKALIETHELDGLKDCEIIDPYQEADKVEEYAKSFFEKRQRKGVTMHQARKSMIRSRNHFGAMMLEKGAADAFISGLSNDYPKTILPALQIVGVEPGVNRVAGMYIISNSKGNFFFADTTVNLNPTAEELVDIIGLTSRVVKFFDTEPRIAMLSYSNFGSARGEVPEKAAKAVKLAKQKWPEMIIDGDIQANVALNKEFLRETYPFSDLAKNPANTLIFPDLDSGNIAYKLLMELGGAEAIGPILMGMNKSVHVLQVGSTVRDIFNMVAIAVVDAQLNEKREKTAKSMINYLEGKLVVKDPTYVVLDVNGVGYEAKISLITYAAIKGLEKTKLFTHLHIKEDAHTLFGFSELSEKRRFLDLISISGVGPSTGLMVLSSLSPEELQHAIINEDVKTIQSVKGIGLKGAQRIVLELKDKMKKEGLLEKGSEIVAPAGNTLRSEALSALTTLGIAKPAAEKSIDIILKQHGQQIKLEELIKLALKRA